MNLIGNKVLVQPEEITAWRGIHIPEDITHNTNPFMDMRVGTVVAIGNGRLTKKGVRIPIQGINVGDRVLLPSHSKTHVDYNGKFHWMLDADLILGKLDATETH